MTTTKAATDTNENSFFNIQYPNCGRGMFSLRQPFKDMKSEELRPASIRQLTPAAVQPIVPVMEERPVERIPTRPRSKRSAQVQCSLLRSHSRHDMAVQTKLDRDESSDDDHYHQKKPQAIERHEKIYEIWEYESPRYQTPPIDYSIRRKDVLQMRHMREKKPIIEYPDEEEIESDYDEERIIYARQPRKTIKKTYLPPNVRMICVRDDANRVSY